MIGRYTKVYDSAIDPPAYITVTIINYFVCILLLFTMTGIILHTARIKFNITCDPYTTCIDTLRGDYEQ